MPSPLPDPRTTGPLSLEEAIRGRRSVREFHASPLSAEAISQLLWATQGVTGEQGYRAAPSAGAFYPLELYVITADGVDHYEVESHALRRVAEGDFREAIRSVSLDQACVTSAPVVLLQAEALGLAGVPVAAFDPEGLARVLSLPEDEEPVYLVPIGVPA